MTSRQPGLRKRLQLEVRRIFHQHEQLDVFFAVAMGSVRAADAGRAREAFDHLRDALEAHFDVEERTHFPAIHGLSPETDEQLAALVREHAELRSTLAELGGLLADGDLAEAGNGLQLLGERLLAHEKIEEQLLAGVAVPSR